MFTSCYPTDASGHFTRLAEYVDADVKNLPFVMLYDNSAKYRFNKDAINAANIV